MKLLYVIKIAIVASLFSGCAVGVAETRSANEVKAEIESKVDVDSSLTQTNRKKPAKTIAANAVCPDPARACRHRQKDFADWEITFKLPAKIAANKTYSSAPFYAVLLKTYKSNEDCDGGEYVEAIETERKTVQANQPSHKVFASYSCPNMDAVGYDFEGLWDKKREQMLIQHFIAIYGGATAAEAETLREQMLKQYPQAVVKKMTANWEKIVQ